MTSSEPGEASPPGLPDDTQPGPPELQVTPPVRTLAAGHLHPGMLFLRMVDGLRQSILPVVIAIVASQPWLAAATAVFFVLGMIYAVARYLTFQYRLTEEELITTEGILHRQERRIPVNRIQDLNFESTLLRRVFRLVVVSVETASGQGKEAQLDSLSRRDANRLREVLYLIRERMGVAKPRDEIVERMLYRATSSELSLLGLTNNRIGAILLALVGAIELFDQFGMGDTLGGLMDGLASGLSRYGTPLIAVFIAGALFTLLLAGWLLSVVANLVMFHGFTLSLRDNVLLRRYGLITTRAQSLPRRRVQRVLIEQLPIRRLIGFAVVRADSAGSGMEDRAEAKAGRDVVVPGSHRRVAEAVVPRLLPGLDAEPMPWRRVSPKIVMRISMKGVLAAAVVIPVLWSSAGAWAWLGLLALPIAGLIGTLAYQNLAYAELNDHVAFRWGILGRYRAYVPLRKVQGAILRAGPIERLLGLAQLTVYVAGGSPTTLGNLPRDEAERLELDIARAAARSTFVW